MPDPLEDRTATTQAVLAIVGAVLLAAAGLALGLEVSVAAGIAGLLAPPGSIALYFAVRQPPRVSPPPQKGSGP